MILVIDVGNTNIVLGVCSEEKLLFTSRVYTNSEKTEDEYAITIRSIFSLNEIDYRDLEGVIISSVVPPVTSQLINASTKLFGKAPILIGPGIKTGLNIKIDNPSQLGSDMVIGAVGAINKYEKPVIIADLGTATKFYAINAKGEFLGGVIAPGLRISLDALSKRAAQLPHISIEAPNRAIGANTVDAMKSGVIFGTADMIDGMITRMEKEIGEKATVIATGGLASFVIPYCNREIILDQDLLVDGLRLLYYKNI